MAACSNEAYEALGLVELIGRRIVKISEQAVIKNCLGVNETEANNLSMALKFTRPQHRSCATCVPLLIDGNRA